MITALDHFVLLCPDLQAACEDYTTVLGAGPVWRAEGEGSSTAVFALGNTALELMAPSGTGAVADRLRALTANGAVLTTLVYRSDDLQGDHHAMTRRGLDASEISAGASTHAETSETRSWQRFRIPDEKMAGIKTFVLEPETPLMPPMGQPGAVTALDHLVINTPNPDRAIANYGARLGIRFALDRTAEQWKTRFMFFRLGGLTLEIIQRLGEATDPAGNDEIWGLTWETDDLDAAHARLSAAGVEVSEVRTGRKPGTRVFTLRTQTQGIPTLFIAHAPR